MKYVIEYTRGQLSLTLLSRHRRYRRGHLCPFSQQWYYLAFPLFRLVYLLSIYIGPMYILMELHRAYSTRSR
jgi:hypothetical protein